MHQLLDDLAKPSWWVTVLLAGLLVNLLAAYVKPYLDNLLGRWSNRRREANATRQRVFEDQVAKVANDSEHAAHLRASRTEARVDEIAWLLWATLSVLWATHLGSSTVFSLLAALCTAGAIVRMNEAYRLGAILDAAHKRRATVR